MILLGINDSHDASACLIIDGKIVGAIQEERLVRKKNFSSFPKKSINYLLKYNNIQSKKIDHVCVATKTLYPMHLWNIYSDFSIKDWYKFHEYYKNKIYNNSKKKLKDYFKNYKPKNKLGYSLKNIPFETDIKPNSKILKQIKELRLNNISSFLNIPKEKIAFFDHHDCHAFYGYYTDPVRKKNVNIVTCDAGGDNYYASIIKVQNCKFNKILKTDQNIIGVLYRNLTLLLNMNPSRHIYKVMGLAPYANSKYFKNTLKFFKTLLKVKKIDFIVSKKLTDKFFYFKKHLDTERFDNIAGAIQKFCEDILLIWFKNIFKKTKCHSFIFSGGVANNVKANQILANQKFVKNLWIPPGPGDESLSIGAVYNFIKNKLGEKKAFEYIKIPQNAYWGPKISQKEINLFSKNKLIKKFYKKKNDHSFNKTAKALANGEVVFICLDSQEFGQRALGHRSIICDPSNPDSVKIINSTIKMRDFWMPFTPSILETDINRYCKYNKKINLKYMTVCLDSTDAGKKHLKSAMHPYDYTIRPQIVEKKTCKKYYQIISKFKKITGIGSVLNTSLNMHEYPIVTQPTDIINEILQNNKNPNFNILLDNVFFELKKNSDN